MGKTTKESTENTKKKPAKGVSIKAPETSNKSRIATAKDAIIGMWKALVFGSIAYSTAVIVMGTEGWMPLVLITPMALFALGSLLKHFSYNNN